MIVLGIDTKHQLLQEDQLTLRHSELAIKLLAHNAAVGMRCLCCVVTGR